MHPTFASFVTDLRTVLNYPLGIKLGDTQLTLNSIIELVVLLVMVVVAEKFLRRALVRRLLSRTHLDPSLQYAAGRIAGYGFMALGFFIALRIVGLDLSSLAVIAGAVGIGIGFGLQNIVSNFISGIIILAERPIAIGHRIEIGGVGGRVTKINLRSTTVVTNDNITIVVPNSDFITQAVTNWSHGDPKVRLRVPVGVAYGTDLDKLRRALLEVAAEHPATLKEPKSQVLFTGFGDSSLNFELAVWTIEMAHHPNQFRSDLFFAMDRKLRERNIEVPFPQRDLHLRSGSARLETLPPSASNAEAPGGGKSPPAGKITLRDSP